MNGINNNISNSNYNSFSNGKSQLPKEDSSVFEDVVDSVKEFFSGEPSGEKYSSYNVSTNSSNLNKAFLDSKLGSSNTYTVAPIKTELSLSEKWTKENESAAIKQIEKEISRLKEKLNNIENKNKALAQQKIQQDEQEIGKDEKVSQSDELVAKTKTQDNQKISNNLPTHTSIPKEVLEKQQNEINEMASSNEKVAQSDKENALEDKEEKA